MTRRNVRLIALILMLAMACFPAGTGYGQGTDEIKSYAIDIQPQANGSLVNSYTIDWCVISNAAGPLTWITLGMPNEQYEIVSYGGEAASARPYDQGFDYKIRIDLPREVNAGECIQITAQIHQYGMAHLDKTSNTIGFQFTPGWFNDIPVERLQISWHLPAEAALVKSLEPKPGSQKEGLAVWETDLQPGEKYPIAVTYDPAAFPDFKPEQSGAEPAIGFATEGPNFVPVGPVTTTPAGGSFSLITCLCLCVIAIIILIVIVALVNASRGSRRSYQGGGFFGGYPSGGGWMSGGGGGWGGWTSSGGGGSETRRSGGGSGMFGGRGMSCACVSSGCACACAGGGRAGCSRKGFDVSSLIEAGRSQGLEKRSA